MTKFKKGDRVICTNDKNMSLSLKKGVVYLVTKEEDEVDNSLMRVVPQDSPDKQSIGAYSFRFDLYTPTIKFEVGKKYKTVSGTVEYECVSIFNSNVIMGYYDSDEKFLTRVVRTLKRWEEVIEPTTYSTYLNGSTASPIWGVYKPNHNVQATFNPETGELITIEKL